MNDLRQRAPAVERNRDPIVEVLRRVLPERGLALEIASGSGEHAIYFAQAFSHLVFLPSDPDENARNSIAAWIGDSKPPNILAPIALDAAAASWPVENADAIICINMTHISPWVATEGLFKGAGRLLASGAPLYLYGPFKRGGAHTAESNQGFDDWLHGNNPQWGVRDLELVIDCAATNGFSGPEIVEMPANNLSLLFRRRWVRGVA
ncbi:MAG: DUF938 domain-containing protein [Methylocystis sp.]